MEETQNTIVEETTSTDQEISETTNEAPSTPQSQLNALLESRMGQFSVMAGVADLKYIKNAISQKVEFTGPNEAYLTIMAILSLENAIQDIEPKETSKVKVSLPASTIESINFFFSKISGKGLESAQRLFSVSMMFRPAMEAIRKLDEEIKVLKSEKN